MPVTIKELIKKHYEFRKEFFGKEKKIIFNDLLKHGQRPQILMIACSDSRVDPAIVTNAAPGELFTIRNVANIVPPYEKDEGYHGTSAALEFAVTILKVKHIVIFGHTNCGGIRSLFENEDSLSNNSFISKWMKIAKPCKDVVNQYHGNSNLDEKAELCAQYSLINSRDNLLTFPFIKERVETKQLFIHSWYFDLSSGIIYSLDENTNEFKDVANMLN